MGAAQSEYVAAADPVGAFLRLLSAALASGRAHVAGTDGMEPRTPESWGWRAQERTYRGEGGTPQTDVSWHPQGRRVGWIDGEDFYLQPESAFAAAQALAGEQGESLPVSERTLWTRMRERGLLVAWDATRQRNTVRVTLERMRREVIRLRTSTLFANRPSQPSQPSHDGDIPDENGTVEWDGQPSHPIRPSHSTVPCNGQKSADLKELGRLGRLGRSDSQGSAPEKANSASSPPPPEMGSSLPCQTGGGDEREAPAAPWIDPAADPRDLETPFEGNGHAP